jgi:hypothetical protein
MVVVLINVYDPKISEISLDYNRKLLNFKKAFETNIFSFDCFQQIDIFSYFCVIFKDLDWGRIEFQKYFSGKFSDGNRSGPQF